ncbi:hypothetical protein P4123_28445 [Pseudomonas aeruginosa]|nr:hypothetical protein [Pseudomonas aeruginosa]
MASVFAAGGGLDPTFVIGGYRLKPPPGPTPSLAPAATCGRGRRERRQLPAPATDGRGGHQYRRRPYGDLRRRLQQAEEDLRRVPPQPAVLRTGSDVRG